MADDEDTDELSKSARLGETSGPRRDGGQAAPLRGESIGRYLVLDELGAGGMGVVFAAYDPELDRKVALKLLKARDDATETARQRLQKEAQALARLNHRNVVAVYDVGVHEGRLFVAMEFVKGRTLGAWMAEGPRPWSEVVPVFMEAGRGLAAAHGAGMVHRDFKPDNVMIDDEGQIRVMDFGLARAEHHQVADPELPASQEPAILAARERAGAGGLTRTGAILGTPAYMPFEQLMGIAADAASDQFSFCVALYEALYGERPFAGETVDELWSSVERGEVRPAPKRSTVPSWLRKVIVRGLALRPEERHASMQALLDELAADPSLRRRRWALVGGLAAVLAVGAWGLAGVIRAEDQTCAHMEEHLVGVWDDQRKAAVKAAIEGTKLSYAPQTWVLVERELDEYTAQWAAARTAACEATRRGEQSDDLLDLRMACLDKRLAAVRAQVDALAAADQTVVEKAVAAVEGLATLDRCADAEALMSEVPPPEDPMVAKRVAELESELVNAEALSALGKYGRALEITNTIEVEARQLGHDPFIASVRYRQGELSEKAGHYDDAQLALEEAYDLALRLRMLDVAANAASELVWLVGVDLGHHDLGLRWATDAKPLAFAAGNDETRASVLGHMGVIARKQGRYEEAQERQTQALAIREGSTNPNRVKIAASYNSLGIIALETGDYRKAREYHERALDLQTKALAPGHSDFAYTFTSLAIVAHAEGDFQTAKRHFQQALAVWEGALGSEHALVAGALNNLGGIAFEMGEYDEAEHYHRRSLELKKTLLGTEHADVGFSLTNLGNVARIQGRHQDAREYHLQALAIYRAALGPENRDVATVLNNLATVAVAEGDYPQARGYHEQALGIRQKVLGDSHPAVAESLYGLGIVAEAESKHDEAREFYSRAMEICESEWGGDHPCVATYLTGLAHVELARGEHAEARKLFTRVLEIDEDQRGSSHPDVAYSLIGIAESFLGERNPAAAIAPLERAETIRSSTVVDSADLAQVRLLLARALWDAPQGEGRDRSRAREFAESARSEYLKAGEASAEDLREVETWLAAHPP